MCAGGSLRSRLSEPGLPAGPEGGVRVPAARAGAGPAQRPRQGHAGEGVPGEVLPMCARCVGPPPCLHLRRRPSVAVL